MQKTNPIEEPQQKKVELAMSVEVGHIRKECQELKGQEGKSRIREIMIGGREAAQDPTVVTGMFLIYTLYANILFDTNADKSYITPKFRKLLDHPSSKLREAYKVENG